MKKSVIALALLLAFAAGALGASALQERGSFEESVSERLRELYEADQAARSGWSADGATTPEEVAEMVRGDAERRAEVLAIVRDGMLRTGDDHFHAAMVLQHGGAPEDYLLAHVLATVGGFEGHESARWLAAASLDRFLQALERPQVFGTQFSRGGADGDWTQEPIDVELFPDSVRARYGVPGLESAAERLEAMHGD